MFLSYRKSRYLENAFLIPAALCLLILSFGSLLLTIRWGVHLPAANWVAEGEANQFEVLRRVEACGILILLVAAVRKTFLSDDSELLVYWRDLINSIIVLFQICCATLGLTNGGIYLINLAIKHASLGWTPLLPFPVFPLIFLSAGFYLGLCRAMSGAEFE